jgi:hypothetical protein
MAQEDEDYNDLQRLHEEEEDEEEEVKDNTQHHQQHITRPTILDRYTLIDKPVGEGACK